MSHSPPGRPSIFVNVSVLGDKTIEPDETVVLTLSNPSGGVTLATASARGVSSTTTIRQSLQSLSTTHE